ncbi:MAG: hypothetical protein ABIP80_05785 [Ferruginibacter sp.]
MQRNILFYVALIFLFFLSACKKDGFITDADAKLSIADSLKFDSVFTTTGSVTRSFKIFNQNERKILISKVKLAGGINSPFRINVNGSPASEIDNLEIAANDSIYIFVSVTINPSSSTLPFIVQDSIIINYNGLTRFVQLEAYGRNAIFLRNAVITGNVAWNSKLPYVILGNIRIDTSSQLTVGAGTSVFLHADAPFIVDGTLILSGTKNEKIIFTGDRLDEPYKNFPGSWPGIYLRSSSRNNRFVFALIKNAYQGVVAVGPSVNANPKLVMQQVIIDNAYDAGLLCVNSNVDVNNCLISNSGSNMNIQYGGKYNVIHCTLASYTTRYITHDKPVLSVTDLGLINGAPAYAILDLKFTNSIFWGENNAVSNEVIVNKQGNNSFAVKFENCLYKAVNDPPNSTLVSVIKNINPAFDSLDFNTNNFDFRISLNPAAPGIDKGAITPFLKDLDDNLRNVGLPDIGCYEKQ